MKHEFYSMPRLKYQRALQNLKQNLFQENLFSVFKKYIHTPCFMVCITPYIKDTLWFTRELLYRFTPNGHGLFLLNNIEKGFLQSTMSNPCWLTFWKWFNIKCPQAHNIWKTSFPYWKFNRHHKKGSFVEVNNILSWPLLLERENLLP